MPRPPIWFGPTDREIDVLYALWELGAGTVAQVLEKMNDEAEISYSTVLAMLRSLYAKRIVDRERHAQRHVYIPIRTREQAINDALNRLIASYCKDGEDELMAIMQERAAKNRRRAELTRAALRSRAITRSSAPR